MPRAISSDLLSSIEATSGTLAVLCKITRTDSTVLGFTNHDVNITYDSQLYRAAPGMDITGVTSSAGTSVDNLELSAQFIAGVITESDVLGGKYDHATYKISLVNYNQLGYGELIVTTGRLGEFKIIRQGFSVELRSLTHMLRQVVGRTYNRNCDVKQLGDARCGVNLAGNTVGGVAIRATGLAVASVTSAKVFTVASMSAYPTGHFDNGLLTWTSGNNNGLSMEIQTYTLSGSTGTFTLMAQMRTAPVVAEQFTGIAGCDRLQATCISKFNNVVNFRGFAEMPNGLDQVNTINNQGQPTGGGTGGEGGGGSGGGDPLGRSA